jgi:hypothetical protein
MAALLYQARAVLRDQAARAFLRERLSSGVPIRPGEHPAAETLETLRRAPQVIVAVLETEKPCSACGKEAWWLDRSLNPRCISCHPPASASEVWAQLPESPSDGSQAEQAPPLKATIPEPVATALKTLGGKLRKIRTPADLPVPGLVLVYPGGPAALELANSRKADQQPAGPEPCSTTANKV